jgi:hypothetical protein
MQDGNPWRGGAPSRILGKSLWGPPIDGVSKHVKKPPLPVVFPPSKKDIQLEHYPAYFIGMSPTLYICTIC